MLGRHALRVQWQLADGARLLLVANLGAAMEASAAQADGQVLYATDPQALPALATGRLAEWLVAWFLRDP